MQKTIYVSDKDAELFDKAKSMADDESISKVIAEALRMWIERQELRSDGYQEYALQPDGGIPRGVQRTCRFVGRRLAGATRRIRWRPSSQEFQALKLDTIGSGPLPLPTHDLKFDVFQTRAGSIILRTENPFEGTVVEVFGSLAEMEKQTTEAGWPYGRGDDYEEIIDFRWCEGPTDGDEVPPASADTEDDGDVHVFPMDRGLPEWFMVNLFEAAGQVPEIWID